jgi:alpha-beta hydrolase superfamily lysophospholipase
MPSRDQRPRSPAASAFHRGGAGTPLVLIHGLTASWRAWQPVLGALEAEHDVFAPTLPGHHGGGGLDGASLSLANLVDSVEALMDAQRLGRAHIVGNSLGGWVALELAQRGRALSVTALSPAGGWTRPRDLRRVVWLLTAGVKVLERHEQLRLGALLRRPRLRRLVFRRAMEHGDRVPVGQLAAVIDDVLGCEAFEAFVAWIRTADPMTAWPVAGDHPVRIAWAEFDRTIPFARYGRPVLQAIPHAEHVVLPGVGHVPMFDDPDLVARTILDVTRRVDHYRRPPMNKAAETTVDGVHLRIWNPDKPKRIVVLVHGYGEHAGRYEHVADRLVADGAVVYAPDHRGHGRSGGEPALIRDMETIVDDVAVVVDRARGEHPGLPVVAVGHSMGAIIASRLAQRLGDGLAGLVLSGPGIGGNPAFEQLLAMDPIPDVPIDPAALSRDPAVGEAYVSDPLVYHGPFKRQTLEALFGGIAAVAEGGRLTMPLLWIHGENDPLVPLAGAREAVARIRGDRYEERIYEGAMHEVLNETNKHEVLDVVAGFVEDVSRQATVAS